MRDCGCIKEKYTPHLSVISPTAFEYLDYSIWMEGEYFKDEYEYILSIYCPLKEETYELTVSNKNGNLISNKDLDYEGEIPDDVYCFSAISCGKKVSKNLFFYGNAQCVIDHLIVTGDERYKELQALVERIRVNVERNNITEASELLEVLNAKIDNIDCGCGKTMLR